MVRPSFQLISFSVLLLGVSLGSSAEVPADDNYLPLSKGAEWTMDAELVSPEGGITKATAKRLVGDEVERNGKIYHRTHTWIEGAPFKFEYSKLTRKDATGFYSIDEREENGTEQMEVKLPLKVGEQWERQAGGILMKESIVGIETVTVGSKTYENCYHIRSAAADGSYVEDYWEAPNVGSVKSQSSYKVGSKNLLTIRKFKKP